MPFFFTATISMLIVLGIMVLVHEAGHFIAAKAFGVRVEVFSIGFGTRLFGIRHGDTDYRICILPLGGYVKMAGELGGDGTIPLTSSSSNTESKDNGPRVLDPGDLNAKPRWQRMIIGFAGPFANFILAFALMTGLYMMHNEVPKFLSQQAVLDFVPAGTPGAKAGLQSGDRILHFDGAPEDPTWNDVRIRAALNVNSAVPVTVQRVVNGQTKTFQTQVEIIDPSKGQDFSLSDSGLIPRMQKTPLKVAVVEPDFPAAKAGLKVGDYIEAVNGLALHSVQAVSAYLHQNGKQPVTLTILNHGKTSTLSMTPKWADNGTGKMGYRLGFGAEPPPSIVQQMPFLAAARKSAVTNYHYSGYILDVLHRLVTHSSEFQQLSGPIGIAQQTGQAVEMASWQPIIALMALISLNLGIMNLLPIPILDGGMITLLIIEGILRHDLQPEIKERLYQVAFVMLILFFAFVMVNDVAKLNLFSGHKL
jgi:regulator of sigma E protease